MDVVVVESPAKAKTINKYLGPGYIVLASYGHIRDLPSKDGSVRPDADFDMDWEVDPRAEKHIQQIAKAVKGADHLYLATDPDREGEAISWHVRQILDQKKVLANVDVKRVVFHEITKDAIRAAFASPRELDRELVDAYLARRALDYLVGFTLSPVLWRKLPGSRSAGRVQSVALRLICERETEIEAFRAQEYWTITAEFRSHSGSRFTAELTRLDGTKLDKMALGDEAAAQAAKAAIESRAFAIAEIERKKTRRNPFPPFTTSTLQMEAARKLRFSAKRTMQVAQRLYEGVVIDGEGVGLITYMRTDGVQMANEAIAACRRLIGAEFGDSYVPKSPRVYKTKAKNAQEAHEAIRPTDVARHPKEVGRHLDADQRALYDLIWKRTVASQMESAVLDQVAVDVASEDRAVVLRATGSTVAFDGFFKLYRESRDYTGAPEENVRSQDRERSLPVLADGEALERGEVTPDQHFTQPPPRFSEASLVKRLEELGIGRPSTYASIISVIQDRNYVRLETRRFVPEDRGRLVTAFLSSFFHRYVEYSFTAELEGKLDDISGGRINWKAVLREFWTTFRQAVDETRDLRVREVLDALDAVLGPHFFPVGAEGRDPRVCPACADGRLSLKLGKFGAFIGCSNYPDCRHTRPLVVANGDEAANGAVSSGPLVLGQDPDSGLEVSLRQGPYGPYVQLGGNDAVEDKSKDKGKAETKAKAKATAKAKPKPKRASLPKGTNPADMDLQTALGLLALPRDVGVHPETGDTITAGIGRYGPYIRHGDVYVSLRKAGDDVLTIGLNRAVVLLAEAPKKAPARTLGDHPGDGKPITQKSGRFGPFVQHGAVRANLPKEVSPETLTLEQAVEILAAREARGTSKKAGPSKKSTPKRKAAPKKKTGPVKGAKRTAAAD